MTPNVLTRGAVRIAYATFGPRDGAPLLLCHGIAAAGRQFHADAEALAAQGFYVIVPDLRGHGGSSGSGDLSPAQFTLDDMALDLLAVLDAEGAARFHWAGNSLGGILALNLLPAHGARFASLTMFGTALALNVPGVLADLGEGAHRLFGRRLAANFGADMTSRNKQVRKLIRSILSDIDIGAVYAVARAVRRFDYLDRALGFAGPMQILVSDLDGAINRVNARLLPKLAARPNVSVVEIVGAGHCANLDQPEAVRRAIVDFARAHPISAMDGAGASGP